MTDSSSISQQSVQTALHVWSEYTFGPDVKHKLLWRRQDEKIAASDEYAIGEVPSRLKETLKLLRAEQLFLMDEIQNTFDEVSGATEA